MQLVRPGKGVQNVAEGKPAKWRLKAAANLGGLVSNPRSVPTLTGEYPEGFAASGIKYASDELRLFAALIATQGQG